MLRSYITIAWRNILRSKVYTFINVVGLSLGVACCLLLTLYIQDELRYDLHHADLDNLYRVTTSIDGAMSKTMGTVSPPIAHALQSDIPEVRFAARLSIAPGSSQNLIRYKDKLFFEGQGGIADSTLFDVLTFEFISGDAAHALTDAHSVVITDLLAARLFGNEEALGQVITIQGIANGDFNVTGVIRNNTKTFMPVNFVVSMNSTGGFADYINSDRVANTWVGQNFMPTFVRLSEGHDLNAVVVKMNQVLQKYGADELKESGRKKTLNLEPIEDIYLRSDIGQSPRIIYLYIIACIAGFMLLIASINFINLSTARATKRAAEIGVRKVMGAFRSSLIAQILCEAMVIVFISIAVSALIVLLALPFFNEITGKDIALQTTNAGYIVIALSLLAIITGLLAGAYPAFYVASFNPVHVLKGKFNMSGASGWLRKGLVVFQFVIAISLVCGVIIISKQLNYMQEKDLGFDATSKIVVPLRTEDASAHYETLRHALLSNASVSGVSAGDYAPGSRIYSDSRLYKEGETLEDAISMLHNSVDAGYIEQLGIKLIAGRSFPNTRANGSGRQVILNRKATKSFGLEPSDIIGQRIYVESNGEKTALEVIGVMEDYHHVSLKEEIQATCFEVPPSQNYYNLMLVSLSKPDFKKSVSTIEEIWKKNVDGTPFEYSFLDEDVQKQYEADQKVSQIVTSFTVIAMLISCLGLYGLSTFMAERRFKEIGVRKTLGATVTQITTLMSTEFIKLVLIAILIAVPIAWYTMNSWLTGFAYRVSIEPSVFVYAAAAGLFIALVSVSFESIRAASANPVKSLKND